MKKLSKINEGMFDNGIRRAHTGEVRKEDDIELYSKKELFDYLSNRYTISKPNDKIKNYMYSIAIPFFITHGSGYSITLTISYYTDYNHKEMTEKPCKISLPGFMFSDEYEYCKDLIDILKNKYKLVIDKSVADQDKYSLYPSDYKDGEVSNKFVIDAIDTITDNMDSNMNPILKRK